MRSILKYRALIYLIDGGNLCYRCIYAIQITNRWLQQYDSVVYNDVKSCLAWYNLLWYWMPAQKHPQKIIHVTFRKFDWILKLIQINFLGSRTNTFWRKMCCIIASFVFCIEWMLASFIIWRSSNFSGTSKMSPVLN